MAQVIRLSLAMAVEKKARSRTNDPAGTRSRILDAAALLFHRKGYSDTSMQDIMQAASVTSGALHYHYPTKKELGLAVVRERIGEIVEEAWFAPIVEAKDPGKGIEQAFRGVIGGLKKGSIAGCPLNNLALELAYAEPDFRKEIQAIFRKWQKTLAKRFVEDKAIGSASGISADELATFVIASYSGAMTMAKSAQSADPLKTTLKLLTRMWNANPVLA